MYPQIPNNIFQYLAAFSGAFAVISSGVNLGWPSPYLPQLLNSTYIPTTSDEGSWCAVMPLVGAPFGAFVAANIGDKIGRKNTTLLMAPIVFFSFIAMAFVRTILLLCILRFIIGATEGVLYTMLPMYIGEISDPKIRGFLASMVATAALVGTLFINIIGQMYSIFTSSLICSLIPLVHFFSFLLMPESPYFYIKKKKLQEAKNSLRILTGKLNVDEKIDELCQAVEEQEKNKGSITDLFMDKGNRRACLIFMIVCLTNKFSGKNPCLFYTTIIFQESGSSINPEMSVIIYSSVGLLATLSATIVVDKFGKRFLFITSTTGCCLFVSILGTYFYLKHLGFTDIIKTFDWIPITSLVGYNIMFSIGLGFATVSVTSEFFPTNVKTVAAGIADSFSVIMGAVVSKLFQITNDNFGMFVPFWVFGVSCAIGLIFIVKFVPETKGKTLEEIQFYLNSKTQKN